MGNKIIKKLLANLLMNHQGYDNKKL